MRACLLDEHVLPHVCLHHTFTVAPHTNTTTATPPPPHHHHHHHLHYHHRTSAAARYSATAGPGACCGVLGAEAPRTVGATTSRALATSVVTCRRHCGIGGGSANGSAGRVGPFCGPF
jgi:hypothetical protein